MSMDPLKGIKRDVILKLWAQIEELNPDAFQRLELRYTIAEIESSMAIEAPTRRQLADIEDQIDDAEWELSRLKDRLRELAT